MNAFMNWLVHPIFQRIGWTLVHSMWEGAAVALVVAIVLALMSKRSAAARYVVAWVALVLMIALPVVTFIVLPGPIVARTVPTIAPAHFFAPIELVPLHAIVAPTTIAPPTLAQRLQPLLPLCAALWLVGIGVISIRHVGGWLRVQRLRRRASPLTSTEWQELMRRICDQLGVTRMVTIAESSLVQVPSVIGFLKPIILLPACAMTGLLPQQLEGLIAHELAHVRRHDYLVNLVQIVIETLLFYHPAAWWISRRIRQERENCCDDLAANVCGNRVAYVQALAAMEELRMVPGELVLAARGGNLLPRVRRLLGVQTPRQRSWSLTAAIVVVLIVLVPLMVARNTVKAQETRRNVGNPSTAASKSDHVLAAGDQILITLAGFRGPNSNTYFVLQVSGQGDVDLRLAGSAKIAAKPKVVGKTCVQAEEEIRKAYAAIGPAPAVRVELTTTAGATHPIAARAARDYKIQANDVVHVAVDGVIDGQFKDRRARVAAANEEVGADGRADLPGIGNSVLAGLTAADVEKLVKEAFEKRGVRDLQVSAAVEKSRATAAASTAPAATTMPSRFGRTPSYSDTTAFPINPDGKKVTLDAKLPEINFSGVALGDAIDFLHDVTGANIFVDWKGMESAGISHDAPVTVHVQNVSFGKTLQLVLDSASDANAKLGYKLEDNIIRIGVVNSATATTLPAPDKEGSGAIDPELKALLQKKLPEVNLQAVALTDAIDFLRDITLANIFVNWQALESAGIDRKTPVTVQVRDVPVAKALQLVLDSASGDKPALAFGVRSNVIVISVKQPDDVVYWNGHVIGKVAKPLVQPVVIGPMDAPMKEVLQRQLPEVNFSNTSFTDAIDFLRDVTNTNFFVNWGALEAAGLDRNSPVSMKLRNVSFQTAMEILLQSFSEAHLAYSVDQGVISITTASAPAPAASQTTPPAHAENSFDPSRHYTPEEVRNLTIEQRMKLRRHTEQHETTQPYRAVRIVVGPQKMTLEGKEVTWDQASEALKKLPDRASTVLEIAMASDQMTLKQHDEAWAQGILVAHQLGFKYASDVGVHALGSKAEGGEFYLGGSAKRTGVFAITRPIKLSQALRAAGIDPGAWEVTILRQKLDKTEEYFKMAINQADLQKTDLPKDMDIQNGDQIMVKPMNAPKNGTKGLPSPTTGPS